MADEKVKFLMRIDPDTDRKIKTAIPLANCRSQNEFVEKALQFYCDYVASRNCSSGISMAAARTFIIMSISTASLNISRQIWFSLVCTVARIAATSMGGRTEKQSWDAT